VDIKVDQDISVTEILDIKYSDEFQEHRGMDIYLPEQKNSKFIMFIHGGGWHAGNRYQWTKVAKYFCSLGYVCASVSYRFVPQYVYPSQVEDVKLAYNYLKRNAAQYGFNEDKMFVFGSSAGGYLSLMLATDEIIKPAGAVLYCPVTTVHTDKEMWGAQSPDFLNNFMGMEEAGNEAIFTKASPVDRITGKECPMIFIHGDIDQTVPVQQSMLICDKIAKAGGRAELKVLKGVKHGFGYGVVTEAQLTSHELSKTFLESI